MQYPVKYLKSWGFKEEKFPFRTKKKRKAKTNKKAMLSKFLYSTALVSADNIFALYKEIVICFFNFYGSVHISFSTEDPKTDLFSSHFN